MALWSFSSPLPITRIGCCLVLYLILAESTSAQTSIVAIRTPSMIVVGADSLAVWDTGKPESFCKIVQVKSFFFAASSILKHPPTNYSIEGIVLEAAKNGQNILETVKSFETLVLSPLLAALVRIKTDLPGHFDQELEGKSALSVVFVGLEANSLILLLRYFTVESSPSGAISIKTSRKDCPGKDCDTGIAYAALGQHDEIDRLLAKNPKFWRIGLVEAVRKLIELEISANPSKVGHPIDILLIDGNGAQWLEKKSQCPEVRSVVVPDTCLPLF